MGKSRLIISANSSSLARWDARLGAQKLPFIAKLSHLSHDGGIITLLDVVIEKMFPLAFVPSGKDGSSPPWGEEEECARQDQWRVRRTRSVGVFGLTCRRKSMRASCRDYGKA